MKTTGQPTEWLATTPTDAPSGSDDNNPVRTVAIHVPRFAAGAALPTNA
jgi:hypothetical protein